MKQTILLTVALFYLSFCYSQNWLLAGNAGTNPSTNFIGTTDAQPLLFRINNVHAGKIAQTYGQTFMGYQAGNLTTTGSYNTAMGFLSLTNNSSGYNNTVMGPFSMYYNTTGYENTAIGVNSLYLNTTGAYNVAVGSSALKVNTTSRSNTAIGSYALSSNTGELNSALGSFSMYYNTTGSNNAAFGAYALYNNTTGYQNTAIGDAASQANTTGQNNTALGNGALASNTTGSANTVVGSAACLNGSGSYNVTVGYYAMSGNLNSYNTGIGYQALDHTTNSQFNTALGFNAGHTYNNGYNNVFLGANTDVNANGFYNVIAIGQSTICTAVSQVTIGNSASTSYRAYANWTNISDGRFKKNVKEDVPGLDFIVKLRPVSYTLDATALDAFQHKNIKDSTSSEAKAIYNKALKEKEQELQMGFIAQEVEKTAKDMNLKISAVEAPKNGDDVYGIRYSELVVPLVKAIQEQQKMIDSLRKDITTLKEQADVALLLRETFAEDKISAYPNPVANDITVALTVASAGKGSLQIFDSGKRLVKEMNVNLGQGLNTMTLPLPVMAAGYYTIRVSWGKNLHKEISFIKSN